MNAIDSEEKGMKPRFRTIILKRIELEPWSYHPDNWDCDAATETDDGCQYCQEEMDTASEIIERQELKEGYEVQETYLSNDPWTNRDEDWEFEVAERKL